MQNRPTGSTAVTVPRPCACSEMKAQPFKPRQVCWIWKSQISSSGLPLCRGMSKPRNLVGRSGAVGSTALPLMCRYHTAPYILDTQITQSDHSETILDPADRHHLAGILRDFVNGAEINGVQLQLSELPVDAASLPGEIVYFPAMRVRDEGDQRAGPPIP